LVGRRGDGCSLADLAERALPGFESHRGDLNISHFLLVTLLDDVRGDVWASCGHTCVINHHLSQCPLGQIPLETLTDGEGEEAEHNINNSHRPFTVLATGCTRRPLNLSSARAAEDGEDAAASEGLPAESECC